LRSRARNSSREERVASAFAKFVNAHESERSYAAQARSMPALASG
jgi:hypothetical protein